MKINKTVIISGAGFRKVDSEKQTNNIFSDIDVKINIGTAIAYRLAEKGYNLMLLSRTKEKLNVIVQDLRTLFPNIKVSYHALDILDETSSKVFFSTLDKEIHYTYVHSAGLSTGTYELKDDNPYLLVDEIPVDLPVIEFSTVVKSLLLMIKGLLPFFKNQSLSKVIVINSMSGIRAYPMGFSHSSAKGGLHNAVRSLSLELSKKNIFFSEIMPGIVDTGMYDSHSVIESVKSIGKEFGYHYDNEIPKMSPYCVADVVLLCIENPANILSVNMVSQGQWTHQSA